MFPNGILFEKVATLIGRNLILFTTNFFLLNFIWRHFTLHKHDINLYVSDSLGFDVAKTGDARIGFVGKLGELFLENNVSL